MRLRHMGDRIENACGAAWQNIAGDIYYTPDNLSLGKPAIYFKVWGQSGHLIPTWVRKQGLQVTLAEWKCMNRQTNIYSDSNLEGSQGLLCCPPSYLKGIL